MFVLLLKSFCLRSNISKTRASGFIRGSRHRVLSLFRVFDTLRVRVFEILLPSLDLVHLFAFDVKDLNATLNIIEDVNKRKRILLSLFELVCSY